MKLTKKQIATVHFILSLFLITTIIFRLYQAKTVLTSKSNYRQLETQFNQSQWRDPKSLKPIDDNTLLSRFSLTGSFINQRV